MPLSVHQMMTNGPIPGESLTVAPGNRPYEKPPQFTQINDAIKFIVSQFQSKENVHEFLAVMEAGAPLDIVVSTMLKHGFAEGKWTPSLAMLLIQPVTIFLTRLVQKAGIKHIATYQPKQSNNLTSLYKMIDQKKAKEASMKGDEAKFSKAVADVDLSKIPSGGLMSPPQSVQGQ